MIYCIKSLMAKNALRGRSAERLLRWLQQLPPGQVFITSLARLCPVDCAEGHLVLQSVYFFHFAPLILIVSSKKSLLAMLVVRHPRLLRRIVVPNRHWRLSLSLNTACLPLSLPRLKSNKKEATAQVMPWAPANGATVE